MFTMYERERGIILLSQLGFYDKSSFFIKRKHFFSASFQLGSLLKKMPLLVKKLISHLSQAKYYRIDIKKKLIFYLPLTCGFNFQ